MTEPWRAIVEELRRAQFADIEGAEGAFVLPVSDRLLTRLVRARVPASAPIRDLVLRADGDDELSVQVRLRQPAFLPAFTIRLRIETQPRLPHVPVLLLRLRSHGLAALAGPVARLFDALPPWLAFEGERLEVRIDRLFAAFAADEWLGYLSLLELHTLPHRFVLSVRGGLPRPT